MARVVNRTIAGAGAGLLALVLSAVSAHAWRSELYPVDWQPPTVDSADFETDKVISDFSYAGYHAGEAPIPDVAGPVFDVTSPPYLADSTGASNATAAIQSAIDDAEAAGGGVVRLPAGTFSISPPGTAAYALRINSPGVVLRGAGVGQTFLINTSTTMRGKSVILVEGPAGAGFHAAGTTTQITTNLPGPATVLPVAGTAGVAVGDYVMVRATCTDAWVTEHNEPEWLGYASQLGGPAYFREVTAVSNAAGTITIDVPTRYYLKTRDDARVVILNADPVREVGLEDFSIANVQHPGSGWLAEDYDDPTKAAYDVHGSFLIKVQRARDCWVRNVETYQPSQSTTTCHLLSNGVLLWESTRVTVSHCHFQRPQYGGGGGNGYMYRLGRANDCLVVDSRATFSRHGFVLSHMGSAGNVYHACIDTDTRHQTGDTGSETTSGANSDHHMHFSHANLIDVCTGDNSAWAARYRPYGSLPLHNLTSAHGVYWNALGIGDGPPYVVRTEQSRYGYAIGTRGPRSGVDLPTYGGAKCDPEDHVEGIGLGGTLEPYSLYLDQRARRLGLPSVQAPSAITLPFPQNSTQLVATILVGGQVVATNNVSVQWTVVTDANQVQLSSFTVANPVVTFASRGVHELEIAVDGGGTQAVAQVQFELRPINIVTQETLLPVADTYVRDGIYSTTNFGASTLLALKDSSVDFNRRVFLKYDLSALANPYFSRAELELRWTAAPTPSTIPVVQIHDVTDDAWPELGTTWDNQPALGPAITNWSASTGGVDVIHVTTSAVNAAAGDGAASFGIQVLSQPASDVYYFRSRESTSADIPMLRLLAPDDVITYAEWIAGYPGIPEAFRGPDADFDNDNLSNAEELLFRRDPSVPDGDGVITLAGATGGITIGYDQFRTLPEDFNYVIEESTSLDPGAWRLAELVQFSATGRSADKTGYRALIPTDAQADVRFYRFKLTVSP